MKGQSDITLGGAAERVFEVTVGSGRIVVPETEAPIMLVNLV